MGLYICVWTSLKMGSEPCWQDRKCRDPEVRERVRPIDGPQVACVPGRMEA